jgi:hypothetical protein
LPTYAALHGTERGVAGQTCNQPGRIVRKISRKLPELSPEERRESAIRLIEALLSGGQLIAGVPTKDGRGFERSDNSSSEIASEIAAAWKPGGPDPNIGDLIWLTAPI